MMTKYKINNNMTRLIKYTLKPKKLNKCVENKRYRQYTHKTFISTALQGSEIYPIQSHLTDI